MVRSVYMDVDAAGAVADGAGLAECADNVLEVVHIVVLENWRYDLTGIIAASRIEFAAAVAHGLDAAVRHGFPSTAFAVCRAVSLVPAESITKRHN